MPLIIHGRVYQVGDTIELNHNAPDICNAPEGLKVEIYTIKGPDAIGLLSPYQQVPEWHSLDGEFDEDGRGWWVTRSELHAIINTSKIESYRVVSEKPYMHKGIDLTGKTCKLLGHLDNGLVFVEFEEHICGCSADGLGKAGHCVAISPNLLAVRKEIKKESKE